MRVLVCYDVAVTTEGGPKRLRRVARACLDHGQRVQNSVFECDVTPAAWALLKRRLLDEFDADLDSLRFYFLGSGQRRRNSTEHHGAKPTLDLSDDALIV